MVLSSCLSRLYTTAQKTKNAKTGDLSVISIKNGTLLITGLLLPTSPALAQNWHLGDNSVGVAIGDQVKTEDESFEGTKLILVGQYALKKASVESSDKKDCCPQASRREVFHGLVDAHLRIGLDDTGLEYTRLGFTPWATVSEPEHDSPKRLRTVREQLELAAIRLTVDDSLEVDHYLELALARAGRIGVYKWSGDSPFTMRGGALASVGWSWAESTDPLYSSVSNPFAGIFLTLSIEHEKLGGVYTTDRFVNGFSFSNPSRGHPTAREAQVRFGYLTNLSRCLTLDIFAEKRSFYFNEGGLPNRYTKSGTFGVQVTCHDF
jgi:hypothetical protein